MNRLLHWTACGALLVAAYAVNATSGVVHFRGAIVESACEINPLNNTIRASCYRDGKWHQQAVKANSAANMSLMKSIADTHLYAVDGHPTLKVLQVSYR